jgi:hypothetical protein
MIIIRKSKITIEDEEKRREYIDKNYSKNMNFAYIECSNHDCRQIVKYENYIENNHSLIIRDPFSMELGWNHKCKACFETYFYTQLQVSLKTKEISKYLDFLEACKHVI